MDSHHSVNKGVDMMYGAPTLKGSADRDEMSMADNFATKNGNKKAE
jgi:hypothetical protein